MIKAGIIINIHMISMINGIEVFRVPDGSAESALFRMCMKIGYFMSFVFLIYQSKNDSRNYSVY